jgi:hypothetical protein
VHTPCIATLLPSIPPPCRRASLRSLGPASCPFLLLYCTVNPPPLILFPAPSIVVASLFALLSFVLAVDALVVVVVVVVVELKGDSKDSTPNCLLTYIPPYRCLLHLSSFVGSPASVFPVNVPSGSPKPKPESVGLTSENNWSNNINLHALVFPDQRS